MNPLDDPDPLLAGAPSPGDILADKYQVERLLGAGGMGVVVAARHLQLDQLVALKLLLHDRGRDPAAGQRFVREARASARITSEHVARVLDVGTFPKVDGSGETPYLVMEYLNGTDLSGLLKKQGPLPIATAVEYLLQACEALAEAHAMGIVHRDLKPANLFLTMRADGSPLVKLLDFGISKALKGDSDNVNLTATNAIIGTPQYMAPEQVRSSKYVDARTDVWALGAILHELITGKPPFVADTVQGLLAAIMVDPPVTLRSKFAHAPPELEAVILRCLEKDPEKRMPDVGAFCAAVAPFASVRANLSVERITRVTQLGLASEAAAALSGTASGTRSATLDPAAMTGTAVPSRWSLRRKVLLGLGSLAVGVGATVAVVTFLGPSETTDSAVSGANGDGGVDASAPSSSAHASPSPSAAAASTRTDGSKRPRSQASKVGGGRAMTTARPSPAIAPPKKGVHTEWTDGQ